MPRRNAAGNVRDHYSGDLEASDAKVHLVSRPESRESYHRLFTGIETSRLCRPLGYSGAVILMTLWPRGYRTNEERYYRLGFILHDLSHYQIPILSNSIDIAPNLIFRCFSGEPVVLVPA